MYFDNYKEHPDAKVNPSLLWEYDLSRFDFQQMRAVVVQRVVERGWPDDWYAILNLYGVYELKNIIRSSPCLNDKDMHFVSKVFEIPLSELKCYERKQSHPAHWNS
jgi:uncharacterized protein DUF6922